MKVRSAFETAVQYAHTADWARILELLEHEHGLATETDGNGQTLLMVCAGLEGSCDVIRKLIQLGANPNHRSFNGSNALAAAIVGGSLHGLTTIPELRCLLEFGADPNEIADSGMPSLHWAIAQNRLPHAKALLEFGVDLDAKTHDAPPESVDDIAQRMGSRSAIELLGAFRKMKRADGTKS